MKQNPELEPVLAVKMAFSHVEGAFGCAVVFADHPDMLIGLRRGSPLLLGIISEGNYVLASDASAVIEHTSEVIYLEEDKLVVATSAGYQITGVDVDATTPAHHEVHTLQMTLDAIEKGGHKHCKSELT
jgi:glucosamine--fructose-6-phosphate aminotransferase (isomerizing)